MDESYIEGRFGIVMEEIRDALVVIAHQLKEVNERLGEFNDCVDTRTRMPVLRVADINKPEQG